MSKRLIIIGAGGLGREVLWWAQEVQDQCAAPWRVAGFLDSNPCALDGFEVGCPVIGDPESYQPEPDELFVCAIGNPGVKLRLAQALAARGARFTPIVHPTAVVGPRARLGAGVVIAPYAMVSVDAQLGDHVFLYAHATIDHDVHLGAGCVACAHCDITGGCRVGEGVFLGSHAVLTPGRSVGDYAVVGAGAVVVRDVPGRATVAGVPARPVSPSTP